MPVIVIQAKTKPQGRGYGLNYYLPAFYPCYEKNPFYPELFMSDNNPAEPRRTATCS